MYSNIKVISNKAHVNKKISILCLLLFNILLKNKIKLLNILNFVSGDSWQNTHCLVCACAAYINNRKSVKSKVVSVTG